MKPAETAKVMASIRIATGAVKSCTSQPAMPNADTAATDMLAATLLFASTSRVGGTTAGRYDS
ncbi:MAG: hypothetical protein ABI289_12375 [Candidatus Dormibacter sp.]